MKKFLLILGFLALSAFANQSADSSDSSEFLSEFESEYTAQVSDPLESYNRFMHKINFGIYDYALSPMLDGYNTAVPLGYRLGITNFFDNLASPLRFVVNLLSFDFSGAMDELGRFALNSTAGLLGLFDVASANGLYTQNRDFGILFGKWGAGDGFYLVLPLLGPSNLRDTLGIPLNILANPGTYLDSTTASISLSVGSGFNKTAKEKDAIEALRKDALDDYILIRDSYIQHRNQLIKGE